MTIIHILTYKHLILPIILFFSPISLIANQEAAQSSFLNKIESPSWESIKTQSDYFYNQILKTKKIKKIAIISVATSLVAVATWYYFLKNKKNNKNLNNDSNNDGDLLENLHKKRRKLQLEELQAKRRIGYWAKRGVKIGVMGGIASAFTGIILSLYSVSGEFLKDSLGNFFKGDDLKNIFYLFSDTVLLNLKWISDLLVDFRSNQIKKQLNSGLYNYYGQYLKQSANAFVKSFESFAALLLAKTKYVFGENTIEYKDAAAKISDFSVLILDFTKILQENVYSMGKTENYRINKKIFGYQDILKTQFLRLSQNLEITIWG